MTKHNGLGLTILLAVFTLSGCSAIQKTPLSNLIEKVPGGDKVVQQWVTEEMVKDIPDPLVRKNMMATWNQGKFRTRSTMTAGKETYVTITEMELTKDGMNYATAQEKDGKLSGEMVYLGDTTYAKDYTDNKWWKETAKPDTKVTSMPEADSAELPDVDEEMAESARSIYKKLGEEACGSMAPNLTCYVYEETTPGLEGKRKFWFDTKDFLTRKEEQKFGSETITAEYTYNNISVKAPSPTKDVPAGKSIYEVIGEQEYKQAVSGGRAAEVPVYNPEEWEEPVPDIPTFEDLPVEESPAE